MYKTLVVAVLALALLVACAWAAGPPTTTSFTGTAYTSVEKAPPSQAVPFVAATKAAPEKAATKKAEPQKMAVKTVAPADVGTTLGRTLTQAMPTTPTTAGTKMSEVAAITAHEAEARIATDTRTALWKTAEVHAILALEADVVTDYGLSAVTVALV